MYIYIYVYILEFGFPKKPTHVASPSPRVRGQPEVSPDLYLYIDIYLYIYLSVYIHIYIAILVGLTHYKREICMDI